MANKFEVSFNSPQCGWMSIGFTDGVSEFHTTTAHTPHSQALSEILKCLSSLIDTQGEKLNFKIAWSRNPEAYNLFFTRYQGNVFFQVVEYPTFDHSENEGEIVFSTQTVVKDFCQSFYETFVQLYEDRNTDEFEFNWRQPFPFEDYTKFEDKLKSIAN
jgi:hypothetical protein